jgi:long-chain acyl-CoA synthetase
VTDPQFELAATHPAAIAAWARRDPEGTAVRWKGAAGWEEWTRLEFAARCGRVAAALAAAGLVDDDRVGIVAPSSPAWVVVAEGAQGAGGITVGAYPTAAPAQLRYVFGHSGARFVFTGNAAITRNLVAVADELPELELVVVIDPDGLDDEELARVSTFADFLARADLPDDAAAAAYYDDRTAALEPDDLATIVYTSGTTGDPKGAVHSFRTIGQCADTVAVAMGYRPDDEYIVYLPLNHTAEQTYTVVMGAQVGWTLNFAQSMATLAADLVEVRPTVMFGVPRVFEKVREEIEIDPRREPGDGPLRRFGLDRLRVAVCGGAPLAEDLVEFFAAFGLRMCNTYGMTEAGGIAGAWDREPRPDTCGLPFPGVDLVVAHDGEALIKSHGLCLGYFRDPDATRDMFTPDGHLRSGDIVELTADGEVKVVDRKKDIIITAGGKNISPSAIEHALARSPYVNQAVVVGNDRRYIVALVEIAPDGVRELLDGTVSDETTFAELATHPRTVEAVDAAVRDLNLTLSQPEQIKRVALLSRQLLPSDPEVTPTMKVKRRPFEARYAEIIDELYA